MQRTPGRGACRALPGFLIAVAAGIGLACAGPGGTGQQGVEPAASNGEADAISDAADEGVVIPDTTIIAAQEALTPTVMALDGVVGTAVGLCDDAPCIKVYLARDDDELRAQIPEEFRGFPVDVEISGEFEARDDGL